MTCEKIGNTIICTRTIVQSQFSEKPFPNEWYEWLGTILGWIAGVFNGLFWIVGITIYIAQYSADKNIKFFSPMFKRFVMYYGLIIALLLLLVIIF